MTTQVKVGEHLDLTTRRISDLTKNGILPASKGSGGYDLDACRVAYIRYLRGVKSGRVKSQEAPRESGDQIDMDAERARLTREQADNMELKNAQLRRELAPVSVIQSILGDIGSQIASMLESIPLKVKRRIPALTTSQIELIRGEVVKAQNAAAKIELDLDEYIDSD